MGKANKFSVGLTKDGRPPIFNSIEELQDKIEEYFKTLWKEQDGEWIPIEPPTVTGLALFLGFASRQSIYDYKKRDNFSYTIKRACLVIENHYEKGLSLNSPTGAIFALKNMGWEDKRGIDHTTQGDKIEQPSVVLPDGKTIQDYTDKIEKSIND